MKSRATAILLAALAVFAAAPAGASTPVFFELGERADIEKGNAVGVSIADNGTLALAPTFEPVFDTQQTYIWSSVADSRGNVYLGTGHEGRIYEVTPAGGNRLVLDTEELDVTALAVDPAGALFAATSPDGKIYRIGRDGASSVYFDPEEKYIWSLAFRDGALYAGTGEKGIVYKIGSAGNGSPWVDTDEVHIVSLAFAPNGDLYAGTDPNALVLRIGADGRPFTVLDSPLQEARALRVGPDGAVYALMIAASAATTAAEGGAVSVAESTTTTATKPDLSTLGTTAVPGRREVDDAKGVLYRVLPDGSNDVLWSSKATAGYALAVDGARVLVGTGDRGRIIAIDPTKFSSTVLVQSTEDQTSTLVAAGSALYATSSNLGKLFRLGPNANARGTYESPVHDAKTVAAWGRIALRSTGQMTVETRSGNTETPDTTWSPWAAVGTGGGAVPSPPARYLQWRLTLSGADARLFSVGVSYLPRNTAPEITVFAVLPAGVGLQELPQQAIDPGVITSGFDPSIFGLASNLPPRRVFQTGARSLIWQAKDPEEDRLAYSLYYRSLSDAAWHPLAVAITTNYYTIDSDALPDGVYTLRLVADDAPTNAAPTNKTGERTTEPIEIDNTPPAVTASQPSVGGGAIEVTFSVDDRTGRVTRGEYSVDGSAWRPIYPEDGIPDSAREAFKVRVAGIGAGEHVVAFRAADASANVGSAKATITVR